MNRYDRPARVMTGFLYAKNVTFV